MVLLIEGIRAVKGQTVTDFRGNTHILTGWEEPRHPGSSGRVFLKDSDDRESSVYPTVIRGKFEDVYSVLVKEIEYAKTCNFPPRELYIVHGKIEMARMLNAITVSEYINLNHKCVAEGINNPKYF